MTRIPVTFVIIIRKEIDLNGFLERVVNTWLQVEGRSLPEVAY